MSKPTTDKLQLELKENKEKVQQLTNMINGWWWIPLYIILILSGIGQEYYRKD